MMKILLLLQVKTLKYQELSMNTNDPRNLASSNSIHNAKEWKTHILLRVNITYILDVGKIKHSPEESKILWEPPHESNHPVQYSITIFG